MRRLTRLDEVEYSVTSEGMRESARRRIGRITLDAKRPGKRRTGNPFAPFEVAGVGDGLTANLHGHEAGNGGHSQGEPTEYRANPRPDRWLLRPSLRRMRHTPQSGPQSPPSIWPFLIGLRRVSTVRWTGSQ